MDKIKIILLVILLSMQYIIALIFKSDISMNITNEDIICSLFIVSLIQTTTMIIDKNYILNIIGIYPISINLVYCICKLKSVKIKKSNHRMECS